MSLTYDQYLQLDTLLNAQSPRASNAHDEMLFIIIHQTYELWFKEMLHEGQYLIQSFKSQQPYQALATLERMLVILKVMVQQTDILETMTPLSFLQFRDQLQTASGFQSLQFRLLEFFLGFKSDRFFRGIPEDSETHRQLQHHYDQPSIYDVYLRYLHSLGTLTIPDHILERDVRQHRMDSDPSVEKALTQLYQTDPKHRLISEKLVDLDEGFQEWRYRHVKMVERTIGNKQGTGGSSGVEYLKSRVFMPAFPELWKIRSHF